MTGRIIEMSGLIALVGQIRMVVEPVDMRRGIDGLSLIVQQALGHSPCAGSAFVFCNRTRNRMNRITPATACTKKLAGTRRTT